jgi:hypothetical protein
MLLHGGPVRNRRTLRRIGCGLLLIPWFLFLLTPCLVITLAVQQEITITYSDLPNHALRIWTLQERNARGVAIANAHRATLSDDSACVIINVRFFLWSGDAEAAGALPVHQCTCYARQGSIWSATVTGEEACALAGE